MPIYQYKCQSCGEITEFFLHGFSSKKKLTCRSCGSDNLQRLISPPNLLKASTTAPGTTCCGRTERCETPPCSTGKQCRQSG
ncbi:zinc ribbon domain-containing protein [Chloroflexota bacterium]